MIEHTTAIKVPTFPEEFKPLIKILNRALDDNRMMEFLTPEEYNLVDGWLDQFASLALEFSV